MAVKPSEQAPKDRYQILETIGSGGGGVVYKAFDTSLERVVAIKRIRPPGERSDEDPMSATATDKTPAALMEEARKLSSLQHGNIVTVHDIGIDGGHPFVVMEFIDGETLDSAISRGRWPLERMVALARPLLSALTAAHERHLMHRDIKPGNVMLVSQSDGSFRVKLLDFGLAKLSPQPTRQTIDDHDGVMGSLHFMAPEQFERSLLDRRTDLYALGCLFYYTLTAELPFDGDTPAEVMAAHLQHKISRPLSRARPDLPEGIVQWVETLMQRQPGNRYQSAPQAAAVLDHLVGPPTHATAAPATGAAAGSRSPGAAGQPAPGDTSTGAPPRHPARPNNPSDPMTRAAERKSLFNRIAVIGLIAGAIMVFATRQNFRWGEPSGADTTDPPSTVSQVERGATAEPVAVLPPSPLAAFDAFIGSVVEVEGTVISSGQSRSGETRYLNFASRPGLAISLAFRTSQVGELFPLSRLESLVGQTVRARGEVAEVYGNTHIFITAEQDLEVVP